MTQAARLNQVLESIEVLSIEDQEMLIDLVKKRLAESRRDEIAKNIAQAEKDYESGNVFRGTAKEAITELDL